MKTESDTNKAIYIYIEHKKIKNYNRIKIHLMSFRIFSLINAKYILKIDHPVELLCSKGWRY